MSKEDDYTVEGEVEKDEDYVLNEEHGEFVIAESHLKTMFHVKLSHSKGGEEYAPEQQPGENDSEEPVPKPTLRKSTLEKARQQGFFAEDESEEPEQELMTGEQEPDSKIASLVAASHRTGRTAAAKRASAEQASQIYQETTGYPLEINESVYIQQFAVGRVASILFSAQI
ncbi:hypothetical protein BC936DRAFT_145724 [Jimgerdemannia flammicorona]|uniref:Uncharacterized protein n=1 Tax=Jimgerdemannia flammicorona TaxID=994334 RepID=A0A433D979_9FUNG|nr:hypothetical protein BC936DRAFT_145724 [Jimgerdemannia flammicorona]